MPVHVKMEKKEKYDFFFSVDIQVFALPCRTQLLGAGEAGRTRIEAGIGH